MLLNFIKESCYYYIFNMVLINNRQNRFILSFNNIIYKLIKNTGFIGITVT